MEQRAERPRRKAVPGRPHVGREGSVGCGEGLRRSDDEVVVIVNVFRMVHHLAMLAVKEALDVATVHEKAIPNVLK